MGRKTTSDFDQELLDLFDGYVHGQIERREFLDKAAKFAVGGLTAATLLETLSPNYALAAQVDAMDARIKGEKVEYASPIDSDSKPTGLGEIGNPFIAAAVANAFHALTGQRLYHMPFTPDRVLAALKA
jgi:hypothetical protein